MNIRNGVDNLKNIMVKGLVTLAAFSCLFFLTANMAGAEEQFDNAPLVGEVRKVYPAEGYLLFKATDGKRQRIIFTSDTAYKGVFLVEEIQEKQKVKVWYVVDNDVIRALKIEVKPELGC